MENSRRYGLIGAGVTAVLAMFAVIWILVSHFSYGKQWADFQELYHTDRGAAVFVDDSSVPYYAVRRKDEFYLSAEAVKTLLNDRFYISSEGNLLYTLPEETVEAAPEQRLYTIGGITTKTAWPLCFTERGELYIALDYAAVFTDMRIVCYEDPDRVFIFRGSGEETWASVTKKAQVRYLAGRKALILDEAVPDDEVCLLGSEDGWAHVRTQDGFVGYMPEKALGKTQIRAVNTGFEEPDYFGAASGETVCLAWHQVFVKEANQTLSEYLDRTEGLSVISPTWFSVSDEEGGISSLAEEWYVREAHSRGLQVWGLVNDFDTGVDKNRLLSQTDSRRALIDNLISAAEEYDLDGINIDFEKIEENTGEHFVQFIRELSVECRRRGLVLSIDNYSPVGGRRWYDVREQGIVADYVIMMGYDEHWSGGTPGSTASISFTRETIDLALREVPAGKLIHGIPFYTRVWGEKAGEQISSVSAGMLDAKKLLEENDADLEWLDGEGQYFGEYLNDGIKYSIWLEDLASLRLKLEAVRTAGLAGVACWKLGLEDPDVWPVICEYLR